LQSVDGNVRDRPPLSRLAFRRHGRAIHAVKRPLCKLDDCLARSVFLPSCAGLAAWMAGTSLAMTVNNI
jgi:hypothetical protein